MPDPAQQPMWDHDCDDCKFIGTVLDQDLYVCSQGDAQIMTIVARYGNDGPAYTSGRHITLDKLSGGGGVPVLYVQLRQDPRLMSFL